MSTHFRFLKTYVYFINIHNLCAFSAVFFKITGFFKGLNNLSFEIVDIVIINNKNS